MAPLRARPWRPLALLALMAGLLGGGCAQESQTPGPPGKAAGPTQVPRGQPLKVGDALPALSAEGWLNGMPPAPGAPNVRLLVVDIWADWCPYCRQTAPDLVRLFQKYSPRGVAFVSLTNMPRASVEAFVSQFAVPWANGYAAPPETLAAFGVGSGMPGPGHSVAPTLYVAGADGRVRWSDRQGRFKHAEPKEWARQLDEALEAALASPAPAGP